MHSGLAFDARRIFSKEIRIESSAIAGESMLKPKPSSLMPSISSKASFVSTDEAEQAEETSTADATSLMFLILLCFT